MSNRGFERSMNGINDIEVNEVQFPDGSTISSASNLVQLDTNNNFTSFNTFNVNLPTSTLDPPLSDIAGNTILNKNSADKLYSTTDENDYVTAFSRNGTTGVITLTTADTGTPLSGDTTITSITDAQISQITTNANNIATNTSNIATNTSNIATNTANISTNTSNITTNTANITTNTNDIATLDGEAVKLSGNQTIAGVKTFSSPPECSTAPTTSNQLANKSYVDSQAGTPSNMVTTDTTQTITGQKQFGAVGGTTFPTFFTTPINQSTDATYLKQTGSNAEIEQTGTSSIIKQSGTSGLIEQTNSTSKIITQGKIGIGTGSPNYALEVIGEAFFNDTDAGSIRIHSNQINFEGTQDFHGSNDFAYIGRINNDLYIVNGNNNDNDIRIYPQSHPVTYTGGTDKGRVVISNYSSGSDNRIKHNEEIITNALNDIRQLTPKKYWKLDDVLYDEDHNFNFDNSGNPIDDDGNRVSAYIEHGLIAQDVLKIDALKYFVGKPRPNEENSTYTLEYINIFVHTISAVKELDAIVSQQQTKINELNERIKKLEDNIYINADTLSV